MTTTSQFHRVKGGALPAPGKCATCGNAYRDCLDFGFDFSDDRAPIERMGAVLLCELCFTAAAREMGFVSFAEAESMVDSAVQSITIEDAEYKLGEVLDTWRSFLRRANNADRTVSAIIGDTGPTLYRIKISSTQNDSTKTEHVEEDDGGQISTTSTGDTESQDNYTLDFNASGIDTGQSETTSNTDSKPRKRSEFSFLDDPE